MAEPSAWRMERSAKWMRERARKLLAGQTFSAKETAKHLHDAAYELEVAANHWEDLKRRAEVAEAWRAGFEAKETQP